jgi:hypothetical protein
MRWLAVSLIPALVFSASCAGEPATGEPPDSAPKADAEDGRPDAGVPAPGEPDAAPAPDANASAGAELVELRLVPSGRRALATGEEVPLGVIAVDAAGATRDVTAEARFSVRSPEAGEVRGTTFVAGPLGSRATTVVASFGGLAAPPLLVSTLAPMFSEGFETARHVELSGAGVGAWSFTAEGALSGRASLALELSGAPGDRFRVTLPLAAPLSATNVERALLAWRLSGEAALELRVGTLNGAGGVVALEKTALALAAGEARHASLPQNGSFFDASWDARAVILEGTFTRGGRGRLVLDDLRILRQFILGANLAWLDGAYDHDFGKNFHHPTWSVAYDPAHMEEILAFSQEQGIRLLRIWVFEGCEGLVKDEREIVTGLDETLLASFDDLVFRLLPKYDVKVYLTLLGAHHMHQCSSPSPLPPGPARDALVDKALEPFARRYGASPWVWGFDLMNEPEGAVGGRTGNWGSGVDWETMRGFLTEGARRVRAAAPRAYVSAGSGWHGHENVRDGRFSGLGFTHLDFHEYDDAGALPPYADLLRHARVLLGEVGQETERTDDALQTRALAGFLSRAASQHYWGVLAWYIDRPGSTNHLTLLDPASGYGGALRPRPAVAEIRELARTRGDIGP